jgi:large subunit ribosomal protein L20
MSRTKGGTVTHRRHKKVLDQAKGYYGARSRNFRTARGTQVLSEPDQKIVKSYMPYDR